MVRGAGYSSFESARVLTDQLIEPKEPQMEQRVALVTGGASGIGEEVCRLLAEHQFLVAVCDIDREKAETVARSIGGIGLECDVASPQSVQSAASRCTAELGAPDFAHLNAGIMTSTPGEPYQPIETVPLDAYRKIMGVNLDGVFNGLQTFCRLCKNAEVVSLSPHPLPG